MSHPLKSFRIRPGWSEFNAYRANPARGNKHLAIDYYAPAGTPVVVPGAASATVMEIGNNPDSGSGYGHYIILHFGKGRFGLYAHLAARAPWKVGDEVFPGQVLGKVGNTGNAADVFWTTEFDGKVQKLSHLHESMWIGADSPKNRRDGHAYWKSQVPAPAVPKIGYEVYYCTTGIGKGWWYVVGNGKQIRTRIPAKKNLWIRKHGFGGSRTLAQIQALRNSPTGR